MTDIEKKALALLNEVEPEIEPWTLDDIKGEACFETLCRAIEQHEAFRQEVSDAVEAAVNDPDIGLFRALQRFIIAKPDPLVEVIATALLEGSPFHEDGSHNYMGEAKVVAAAIKKRGGKIVWEDEQ